MNKAMVRCVRVRQVYGNKTAVLCDLDVHIVVLRHVWGQGRHIAIPVPEATAGKVELWSIVGHNIIYWKLGP